MFINIYLLSSSVTVYLSAISIIDLIEIARLSLKAENIL